MNPFVERHQAEVSGVLSCFDRVVITGTLPEIGHAAAMTQLLASRGIRVFDYTQWAEPLRQELRQNAERLAAEAGLEIEFIRRHGDFRKEARIQDLIAQRGDHPGLVHVFAHRVRELFAQRGYQLACVYASQLRAKLARGAI